MILQQNPKECGQSAVALGNFDGVHLGHRVILNACVKKAREMGIPSLVWTFRRHPQQLMGLPWAGNLLSPEEKFRRLESLGLDRLYPAEFEEMRDLSPTAFCEEVLLSALGARAVFCGFNFRFGKNGAGDAAFLSSYLQKRGVEVFVADPVTRGGETVSSSRIRALLALGNTPEAAELLGEPYSVSFPVERGKQWARRWGMPTLNQAFPQGYALPRFGVYAVKALVEGQWRDGVCNVGRRPSVEDGNEVRAETHLLDYSGDLYGKNIRVCFYRFLREERRFDSLEALKEQMARDCDEVRRNRKEKE